MSSATDSAKTPSLNQPEADILQPALPQLRVVARPTSTPKGFRFWMVFMAICVSLFLSAVEFNAVGTVLPTIVHDFGGQQFVWVGSAYGLAATALLPASGGFAQIFGRRTSMLVALAMFAGGSALCGAAQGMNFLIAGRVVQGAGGGGILSLSSIIVSDLVTLEERGTYNGLIGMTWGVAASLGPIVGGAFAQEGQWRWLFYMNLPISGVAACLVLIFLKVPTPPGTLKEKFLQVDWIGNIIIIGSTSSVIIALTWGGVQFPWLSVNILLPLILGAAGIVVFVAYEALYAKQPIVPITIVQNRTSLSGYIQTFLCPIVIYAVTYFLPVYLQSCKGATPLRSGVLVLGLTLSLGPSLVLTGASVSITQVYRPQLWIGWILFTITMGTMSTLHADSPLSQAVGLPVMLGFAVGMIYSSTYFPVLAPLSPMQNAYALAFFSFCRSFAAVWGISVGTAILQTQLSHRLPEELLAELPDGVSFAYSIIPVIKTLPEPLQSEVRAAFADSVSVIWQFMAGVTGVGFFVSLIMKGMPLHTSMDSRWAMEDNKSKATFKAARSANSHDDDPSAE